VIMRLACLISALFFFTTSYRKCRKAPGISHGDIRHRLERRTREADLLDQDDTIFCL